MFELEVEQAARGPVTLEGWRGGEQRTWVLGPNPWGVLVRPNFEGSLLNLHEQANELARGNPGEAARRWQSAAEQDPAGPQWLHAWLFARAADVLSREKRWKDVDTFYGAALRLAPRKDLLVRGQLLLAWAKSYEGRGDWVRAEKYYQRSLVEVRNSGAELIVASILDAFGNSHRVDPARAARYYRRALSIQERLTPGSLAEAISLKELGLLALIRGDLRRAQDNFERALEIRSKLAPGSLDLTTILNDLEFVAWQRGDGSAADRYHQQALETRNKLPPNSLDLATSFENFGRVTHQRGNLVQAEDDFRRALEIRERDSPDGLDVATSLHYLGLVAMERGDLEQAKEYHERELALTEKLAPASFDLASAFNDAGMSAWRRGDLRTAERDYRGTLEIYEKLDPEGFNVAATLNNLGLVTFQRGDLDRTEKYYRRALVIQERLVPEGLSIATTMNNLGLLMLEKGDLTNAQLYCRRALAIGQKAGSAGLDLAYILNNLAAVAVRKGDLAKAEDYAREEMQIKQKLAPGSLNVATAYTGLGKIAESRGNWTQAEVYYRRALEIMERVAQGTADYAGAVAELAGILRRTGRLDQALVLYQNALDALEKQMSMLGGTEEMRSNFRARHLEYYNNYIDALIVRGKPDLAFVVLERSRAQSVLEMLRAGQIDIRKGVAPDLVRKERSIRADIQAKSSRRIQLLSDNRGEQVSALDAEIGTLLNQYEEVEEQIRISSPGYSALTKPQALSVQQVQQLVDPNTLILEYDLGKQHSYVFVVSSRSITAYQLPERRLLDAQARHLYNLLTAPNKIIPGEGVAQRQIRMASSKAEYDRAAAQLSQAVLGPIASQLGDKRLLVVSDGALSYVPFAALPIPDQTDQPLVVRHEVVSLPSASVLAALRNEAAQREKPPKAVAVLADPVFDARDSRVAGTEASIRPSPQAMSLADKNGLGWHDDSNVLDKDRKLYEEDEDTYGFLNHRDLARSMRDLHRRSDNSLYLPRLQFTRSEAASILAVTPSGEGMEALDFDASRSTAMSRALQQYRIVHFATHGLLNNRHPELSGLVLSMVDREGKPQDGFLSLQDIYNLNLRAELVVLSACETFLGKEVEGEGLVGVTRGFMYAGASRVVASLWKIDDRATANLMAEFYKAIEQKRMRPAAALREAQIAVWKQKHWSSPYYWAAFQIQGEWQ